jgi:hypothetical protein
MLKILFMSAVGYLAYRYISSSNKKAREITAPKTGTVEILAAAPSLEAPQSRQITSPAAEFPPES